MTISSLDVRHGAQRPRRWAVPDDGVRSSAGDEAVELARSAGLVLDDWQQWVLRESLRERADGRWAAFESCLIVPRQNGKGSILEALELAGLVLFGERLIVHSAHQFKTAQEHFLRMQTLVETCEDLRKRVAKILTGNTDKSIVLKSGARLLFLARSGSAARGFSGDRVILDEAFKLPAEAVGAMLPALSARPNPQVWYTSSAPHYDSHVLHGLRRRGVGPDPGRLFYAEWGCEPGVDLDDREAWYAANPALGIRISEEFVENELAALRALGDEFVRERLGVASDEDAGHGVFGPGGWPGCADPGSRRSGAPVFSFDVGPDQAWASIGVAGRREDGLVHVEVVECRPGSGWLVERLQKIQQGFGQAAWFDSRGPAAGIVPELESAGVMVEALPGGEFSDACAAFQRGVLEGQVRHLDQRSLNDAVAVAARRQVGDAWVWARARSDADITALVAVTAAYWSLVQAPVLVPASDYFSLSEVE